jgi:hypothetical protein
MVRAVLALVTLAILVLVSGCGGGEARSRPLNRGQAAARTEVMELKVVKVWDVVSDALNHDREPGISHYIEVDVLSGSAAGTPLTLPFDEWNVGGRPPAEGTTVVVAPADWVRRAKDSRGRPFGGW